jgi:SAM-dependent methyltransferase
LHRYAYAANNPVSLTDPSGLMPHLPTAPFGNGGLLSPPQPSAPQYDLTGRADGFRGIVDAANQLSRALSQGAHAPECGPTGVLGDWWQSLQRGTLGPDLLRWGLNEYRTNPLWQRQFTDAELRQLTIDLAKRGEFGITRLLHQIVDEKGLQHWLTGQVDYAVQALRDPHMYPVLAFNLGVGLIATGIGAASLPAIAAVGIGSLVANVAFQTWVESGAGLSFNLEAFRSSLGINSAATVPGLIGGMIGARFGPWGRYIGAAIGSGLSQILTNKLMGRDWDEGLLLNMGLSVGMEGVMAGVEHVAGRLENLNFGQKLREWGFADERLYAVESSSRRLFDLFKSGDEAVQGGLSAAEWPRGSSLSDLAGKQLTGDAAIVREDASSLSKYFPENPQTVIDLGSGGGVAHPLAGVAELAEQYPNASVIGTDMIMDDFGETIASIGYERALEVFAPGLKKAVQELPSNASFVMGDFSRVIATDSGDLVTSFAPYPPFIKNTLEQAARIAKPGGTIVIASGDMNTWSKWPPLRAATYLNELTGSQVKVFDKVPSSLLPGSSYLKDYPGVTVLVVTKAGGK